MPPINLNGSSYNKTSGPASYESMQPNGTPWPSVAAAHAGAIYKGISHVRLVNIGGVMTEYWYVGGTDLVHLVPKSGGASGQFMAGTGDDAIQSIYGDCEATGPNAFAIGTRNTANGASSVVLGSDTTANGSGSFAVGQNTVANGNNSFAQGNQTQAIGQHAVVMHQENVASGGNSLATGLSTAASGASSISGGQETAASGANAVALGTTTQATGANAVALGSQTTAQGANSFAHGNGSLAEGDNSVALGEGAYAKEKNQAVVGKFNEQDTIALFVVGNGIDDTLRKNAFTVRNNGAIVFGDSIEFQPFVVDSIAPGPPDARLNLMINGIEYYIALTTA